jgi:hypothetical protein
LVQLDRRPERDHVDQADVAQLQSGQDHQDETDRIGPVPDPDRERVNVDALHVGFLRWAYPDFLLDPRGMRRILRYGASGASPPAAGPPGPCSCGFANR